MEKYFVFEHYALFSISSIKANILLFYCRLKLHITFLITSSKNVGVRDFNFYNIFMEIFNFILLINRGLFSNFLCLRFHTIAQFFNTANNNYFSYSIKRVKLDLYLLSEALAEGKNTFTILSIDFQMLLLCLFSRQSYQQFMLFTYYTCRRFYIDTILNLIYYELLKFVRFQAVEIVAYFVT